MGLPQELHRAQPHLPAAEYHRRDLQAHLPGLPPVGNMLGGVVIVNLVYSMLPVLLRFVFPDILHAYFDIFAGALQAFIFTVLSMTFIQQKAVSEF